MSNRPGECPAELEFIGELEQSGSDLSRHIWRQMVGGATRHSSSVREVSTHGSENQRDAGEVCLTSSANQERGQDQTQSLTVTNAEQHLANYLSLPTRSENLYCQVGSRASSYYPNESVVIPRLVPQTLGKGGPTVYVTIYERRTAFPDGHGGYTVDGRAVTVPRRETPTVTYTPRGSFIPSYPPGSYTINGRTYPGRR